MTSASTSDVYDSICRPTVSEQGWQGFELPTLSGAFAKVLIHPDGSIMFECDDRIECFALDWKSGWHKYLKLAIEKHNSSWHGSNPLHEDSAEIEAFNVVWCESTVLRNVSRATAEEVVTLLRHEVLAMHLAGRRKRNLELFLTPIALAISAAIIGSSAGFVGGLMVAHI